MKTWITLAILLLITSSLAWPYYAVGEAQNLEDVIFSDTKFKNFTLSPSGLRVLFKGIEGDISKGIVFDINENKIVHMFDIPDGLEDTKIFWLNDDELVLGAIGNIYKITLSKKRTIAILERNYSYDREFRELTSNRWYIEAVLPGESGDMILSMKWKYGKKYYSTLFRYDAAVKKLKRITNDQLKVNYWIVTNKGKISAAVKESKGLRSYYYLEGNELHPILTPDGNPLVRDRYDDSKNRYYFSYISENSGNIYVTHKRINGTSRVISIDPKSGKLVKVIEEASGIDLGVKNCNFLFHRHPVTGAVVGYSYYDKKLIMVWLDKQYESLQTDIDAERKNYENRIMECDKNFNFCLVISKIKGMPFIYLYDTKKKKLNFVASEYPEISANGIVDTKSIKIKDVTGRNVLAHFTPSIFGNKTSRKVVVIPCGYLDLPVNGMFREYENYFSLNGYDVINITSAGCRGNGNKNIFMQKNLIEITQKDIDTVIKALFKEDMFQGSKVYFLSTTEFGSLNAVIYSEENPNVISALATFSLPLDLFDLYKWNESKKNNYHYSRRGITAYYASRLSLILNSYNGDDREVLKRYALWDRAVRGNTPLLIASGDEDRSPIRKGIKKLSKKRKSKLEWVDLPDIGLCMCGVDEKSIFAKKSLEFFQNN